MHRRSSWLKRLLWSSLLALSLGWALFHDFSLPSYSQTTPPSPREALEIEIKEDVARHLEIRNAPLDHSSIRELYFEEAATAGLTYEELIDLYETEYAAQKAAQAPSPWEQYLPNAGWLVGLAGLAIAAYVTVLKKWFEARFNAIGNWIYKQLSGTYLFREIALRKYRDALVDSYKHLPMPFLRNRAPLNMEEVYVPLKVSETREEASSRSDSTAPRSHELLDAYKAIAEHRRLMVIGEPGSGKSVLLKHMAWSYGEGKLDWLPDRPVVVLLELYRLSDDKLDKTKLIQALFKAFDRNQFPNAEQFVQQTLENGTLMLLLDGLDEVSSDIRQSVVGALRDFLKTYAKCRAVITCRTAIYNGEFNDVVDRKLEVVEFTDQQIQQFLKAWEADLNQARKSVGQLMTALAERPLILKLARNPLLLTLVAYLYAEPAFVLPRSRADFYQESTRILLEQREYKGDDDYKFNRYDANEKRRILQHLALYTQEHRNELRDRRSLSDSVVREQIKQVLPDLDIAEDEASSILDEIAERSGLLMEIDGGDRFLFPHLTLQEFFAATALKEDEAVLIDRFRADPAAWREVVKLWCSLANDSTTLVQAVYEHDALTGFECLAEARKVAPALVDEIINHFKPVLDQPQTNDTVMAAFGAVAANERGRGKAVFSFLKATLLDAHAPDQSHRNAANALSRTNLQKAADVLLHWYRDSEAIVRMGDVAVPGLSKLARKGNSQAVDDLFAIGTSQAAIELTNLLWYNTPEKVGAVSKNNDFHDFPEVAHRAAWYLAGMVSSETIEKTLEEEFSDVSPGYPWIEYEYIQWIWQPFEGGRSSFMSVITGRIAYLLTVIASIHIPQSYTVLDPRIVVPLCTLYVSPQNPPKELSESDAALLEAQPTPDVLTQCKVAVDHIFERSFQNDKQWQRILFGANPLLQLDIINRLNKKPQPQQDHWRDLFKVVNYDLKARWHYRLVLTISVIMSLIAIIYLGMVSFLQASIWHAALFVSTGTIATIFWLALLVSSHCDPILFKELGIEGLLTFRREYQQLLRNKLIWSGLDPILQTLTDKKQIRFAGAFIFIFAFAFAFAIAIAGAGIGAVAIAIAGAGIGAVAGAGAGAGDSAVAGAGAGAFAGAVAGAVTFAGAVAGAGAFAAAFAFAVAGAFAFAVAGAGAGAALETWHGAKSLEESKTLWFRTTTFLSFPWFCWFPLTLFSNVIALHELLKGVSPLTSSPWTQTTVISLIFALCYGALWHRGLYLDARARNPFQQGHIGKALTAKR